MVPRRNVDVAAVKSAAWRQLAGQLRYVAVRGRRIRREGDFLPAPVGVDHQAEFSLLGRRERAERRELGRQVEVQVAAGALHRRDHVVERQGRRSVTRDPARARKEHRIGAQPQAAGQCDEQGRFVLAVAVAGREHRAGEPRLEAADPERE